MISKQMEKIITPPSHNDLTQNNMEPVTPVTGTNPTTTHKFIHT